MRICDDQHVVIGGIMEHIEEAGVHSGDSACSIPPVNLSKELIAEVQRQTKLLGKELKVKGLMNIQYAIKDGQIYILEVNPRASRTVPFVSKAIGVPLAKLAAKVMAGMTLEELGFTKEVVPEHYAVKESVFPFLKFPGTDVLLGPEMLSTGEVMGLSDNFGTAYAKSQIAAGNGLPTGGNVLFSVKDADKAKAVGLAKRLQGDGLQDHRHQGHLHRVHQEQYPVGVRPEDDRGPAEHRRCDHQPADRPDRQHGRWASNRSSTRSRSGAPPSIGRSRTSRPCAGRRPSSRPSRPCGRRRSM